MPQLLHYFGIKLHYSHISDGAVRDPFQSQ